MRSSIAILLLILFACPWQVLGQHYHTRNLTMADGMPSNSVRSLLKDSSGYLWVGTDAGLCRFDGKRFRIYSSRDGFDGAMIWSMAEDGNGNMWFGDYGGGLWKYDGIRFRHYTKADSLVDNRVRKLYYSRKWDLLMVGTQAGITVYDGRTFSHINRATVNADRDPWVMEFLEFENMIGIYTFDPVSYGYYPGERRTEPFGPQDTVHKAGCMSRFKTSGGEILRAFRNGIEIYGKDGNSKVINKPGNAPGNRDIGEVFGMAEDRYGNVWLASWTANLNNPGGLFFYDGERILKRNDILNADPIAGWCIHYDDEEHILWFGTLDMGLFMIQESIFEYIAPAEFGLTEFNISDLAEDPDGNLFILNKKGLVISYSDGSLWNVDNRMFFDAYLRLLQKKGLQDPRGQDFTSFMNILDNKDLAFQDDTNLWVTSTQGYYRISSKDRTVECILKSGFGAGSIQFDSLGRMVSTPDWGPYGILEPDESGLIRYKTHIRGMEVGNFTDVLPIPDMADMWMSSWTYGLFKGWDTVFANYNSSNSPLEDNLTAICRDNRGNLVIGSNSGILYLAKPRNDSLEVLHTITPVDGLHGNSINWLEADLQGQLWVGTNTGLNLLDLNALYDDDSPVIRVFDKSEGYLHPNVSAVLPDKNGNILLGTDRSLVRMHPASLDSLHTIDRRILLTGFGINGRAMAQGPPSGPDGSTYTLPASLDHKQNYLHFDFDVINFINPEKDRFRFFLEGVDMGWSDLTEARLITYPNLRPGSYTLHVEGRNLNTGKEYRPLTVTFRIRAPFWRTWWFITMVVAAGLAAVTAGYRNRIGKARREEQKKAEVSRQLAELEMKALLAQMNPHFTFNAINSIQNYILDNDVDKALSYLSDFSKIIRQTLENASKEFITLEEEVDYIRRYLKLEQMRFDNQFELELTIDPAIDPGDTKMPPMILQPYVENAIKHGLRHKKGKGRLSITFTREEGHLLRCTVEDNGVGRAASAKINSRIRKGHSGAGMEITRGRILKLREVYHDERYDVTVSDITPQSGRTEGTRVEVTLPLMERL